MLTANDFDSESLSYFPLLVEVKDSKQKIKVMTPEEIPSGKEITVLQIHFSESETNVTPI